MKQKKTNKHATCKMLFVIRHASCNLRFCRNITRNCYSGDCIHEYEKRKANFYMEDEKIFPKINKLKEYLWIVSMCVLKCFIIL